MNEMRTGRHPSAPPPGEAEDRFTSEGGSLGPQRPTASQHILPTVQGDRRVGDDEVVEQPREASVESDAPTTRQTELMQDMNVDFCEGTYRYERRRFLRFEEAIDYAETTRRSRGRDGK